MTLMLSHPTFGSDAAQWAESMHKLLGLDTDILCEGHFGIFRTKDNMVKPYIRRCLKEHEQFPP